MATKRLTMRKAREILRMKWHLRWPHRRVAKALRISVGAVGETVGRAKRGGLTWAEAEALTEEALEQRLYGLELEADERARRPLPNYGEVHAERMRPHVTLALLHEEYVAAHPDGYGYTQFCAYYRRWLAKQQFTMKQEHRAGDKLFVDYSGKKPHYVDVATGERVECELFVATLGASNHTYAEATHTQRVHDFLASHERAFAFYGGVPAALVPDQLKSAVTTPSRYEPGVQRAYDDLAEHYGTAVVPARPRKPRDKAKVEVAVQIAQRWILARLRKQKFFSLDELNARIAELVEQLADRHMRKYGMSRRELFARTDQPELRALPTQAYERADWAKTTVGSDYHVDFDRHAYSVPHRYIGEAVEIRATATTVEVLCRRQVIATHVRSSEVRGKSTKPEHMPVSHRQHAEWTPARIRAWASEIGPETRVLVDLILAERPHPEQGYRSCLGLLRLQKRYSDERLERACRRARMAGARSYKHVKSILERGLDQLDVCPAPEPKPVEHPNVRGGAYYAAVRPC